MLYISSDMLLKPGEKLPVMSGSFLKQVAHISRDRMLEVDKAIAKCEASAGVGSAWAVSLKAKAKDLRTALESPETSQEKLAGFSEQADEIIARPGRVRQLADMQRSCEKASLPTDAMIVGWASSTEKILPRDMLFAVNVSKFIAISAARNEKESFQIVVTPSGVEKLRKVSVTASDLRGRKGAVLASSSTNCRQASCLDSLVQGVELDFR